MSWNEVVEWLKAMKRERDREREATEVSPDSWQNVDRSDWWQNAKRDRDKMMGRTT